LERGLEPGERVLVQLGNTAGFIATVCGLFRAGLVPVYALPAHRITELVHFARKAEASAYITTDLHDGFDHRALAQALQAEVPAIREVVIDGNAQAFTALDALQGDRARLPADPDPQSVAFLQISGGSTGLSKLIPRTHDDYI
ncbi:AMP-binding protein, partial [Stutzerimonas stutzeri]|uniref:AMP-binding protein n=2 Tax=Gammaproteobacteria TaxID=1236 RepID=UPI001BD4E6C0